MPQGRGLGQVLVQVQRPRDGAGDLRDFERVGQPGDEMILRRGDEDLRLVLEPPEGLGVEYSVAVALVVSAHR